MSAIKNPLQYPQACDEVGLEFKEKLAVYEAEGQTMFYVDECNFTKDMPRSNYSV
jgi:hypothetical protein